MLSTKSFVFRWGLAACTAALCTVLNGHALYPLQLQNIHVSHGTLEPKFDPSNSQYKLILNHPYAALTVSPEVQGLGEYEETENNWPLVDVRWDGRTQNGPQSTSMAVQNQKYLPGDGRAVDVTVSVINPKNLSESLLYSIHVEQNLLSSEPHVHLRHIYVEDSDDNSILVSQGNLLQTYLVYLKTSVDSFSVTVECASGNSVSVNNEFVVNGNAVTMRRETWHHGQIVIVECYRREGIVGGDYHSKVYTLEVLVDNEVSEIKPPKLVVDGSGQNCTFDNHFLRYLCPNPSSATGLTRLISYGDTAVRYTVESAAYDEEDQSPLIQVRLVDGLPSTPFTYTGGDLKVVGWAGHYSRVWRIEFQGASLLMWISTLGWFLTATLTLLFATLIGVLGLSAALGIGTPLGAAEIAANSTFLLQFLCFAATFLRQRAAFQGVIDMIKWVTLFWPCPWEVNFRSLTYRGAASMPAGAPFAIIGDTLDLTNAKGCLFWATVVLCASALLRLAVTLNLTCWERRSAGQRHTFPHRLLFGHWECRAVHFLLFPVMTASCLILSAPDALSSDSRVGLPWELAAILALLACCGWIGGTYAVVRTAVRDNRVTWVWNTAMLESGVMDEEDGYWSDVVCDQLNTHAVNRGLLPSYLLPWKWMSTVADIEPIVIWGDRPRTFRRSADSSTTGGETDTTTKGDSLLGGSDAPPLGGSSTTVEVKRTRAPGMLCPGQRMVAGLVRFDWIDVLFTFQSMTHYHTQIVSDTGAPYSFPVTAKVSQLQGPFSSGRFCFFFDGIRVPFIKIEDSIFRAGVGLCMGLCLALQVRSMVAADGSVGGHELSDGIYAALASLFGIVAGASAVSLLYVALTMPYSRRIENLLLCSVLSVLTAMSTSFMGYAVAKQSPSTFAEVFFWIAALMCVVLAIYSSIVIFSLIVAMTCPPLEETRYLERLANVTLTIADHSEGWAVDMPAYSKYYPRNIKAVCQYLLPPKSAGMRVDPTIDSKLLVSLVPFDDEATVEFGVVEVKRALSSGVLRRPIACLFAPSNSFLGYKSQNIDSKEHYGQIVHEFLVGEPLTKTCAKSLARHITAVVDKHKANDRRAILCMTVIPPSTNTSLVQDKNASMSGSSSLSPRTTSSYASSSVSTFVSSRSGTSSSPYTQGSSSSSSTRRGGRHAIEMGRR